jgi:Flp pilus assembly protein TadD
LTPRQTSDVGARAALIHRENLQIGALILIAIAAFFATRAVAASNRRMSLRDAAEWHRRGQEALAAGRVDEAVDDLRRATIRNRQETPYVLTLARALQLRHDNDEARRVLLTLRESAPEDAEVNLALARLDAARHDLTEAIRFYHNALYAVWPAGQEEARRRVRLELIRFLLAQDQTGRALSELLAIADDAALSVPRLLEIGRLFADAGDWGHALEQFQRVLRTEPANGPALAAAGDAAFRLGEYPLARRYLRLAPASARLAEVRNVVDLLLARDPLASRIGSAERRRRLAADLSYVRERVIACAGRLEPAPVEVPAMAEEASHFSRTLQASAALDQDTIEAGLDVIERIEQFLVQRCGPAAPLDRALLLIAREHRNAQP